MAATQHFPTKSEFSDIARRLLSPEAPYYRLAVLFSAFISLLTLAVPISIQMLIDQVANTALLQPLLVLVGSLFVLLLISGLFFALREYVLELFERRIYARLTSEITLKVLNAPASFFDTARRDDLINRYFDIMTVKKTLPYLLVGLFSFFFQAGIGFAVTSLYHPALLIFNVTIILCLVLIWWIWSWRATEASFYVSESKYDVAAWIEGLSHQADLYKAGPHSKHALQNADRLINTHIGYMRSHFKLTFRQLIALLGLYALSASALLGIGGYLVILGELTLGQLVAAELILSAIFANFGLLGSYFKDYYDLAAALEELNRFKYIPSAREGEHTKAPDGPGDLEIRSARVVEKGYEVTLSGRVPGGTRGIVSSEDPTVRRTLARLLKGHVRAASGSVKIDNIDVRDWDDKYLHEEVVVIDRHHMPQMQLGDFLRLAQPSADHTDMEQALDAVGLIDRLDNMPNGFETTLAPSGWPFTAEEVLRLKLAGAILDAPRLLVLSDLYDQVDASCIHSALETLESRRDTTCLVITDRTDLVGFDEVRVDCEHVNKANPMSEEALS